jgi:hypothetical protein
VNHPTFHEAIQAESTSNELPLVLRLCTVHDDAAIDRLAALEGRHAPSGRFVVAELAGEIVAALPIDGGPALADPFRSTLHLLPLMRLRARQLEEAGDRRRGLAGTWRLARN